MSKSILILTTSLVFICFNSLGQTKYFSSVCFDSETKKELVDVNIQYNKTGTSSDINGFFAIEVNPEDSIKLSYVGYETLTIVAIEIQDTIYFKPNLVLEEVIIFPKENLFKLLRTAYSNIEKNYPQQSTFAKGFFRELSRNSENNEINYLSESILAHQIPPYTSEAKKYSGQVKVMGSSTYLSKEFKSKPKLILGGSTIPIEFNYVQRREGFINPKNYNDFDYTLRNIVTMELDTFYVIGFNSLKKDYQGNIYISKEGKSFKKIEFVRKDNANDIFEFISFYEANILKSIFIKWKHKMLNDKIVSTFEYSAIDTLISENQFAEYEVTLESSSPISFIENFETIKVAKVRSYFDTSLPFSRNIYSNVNSPDSVDMQNKIPQRSGLDKFRRNKYLLSVSYLPFTINSNYYQLSFNSPQNAFTLEGETQRSVPLAVGISKIYFLSDKLTLNLTSHFIDFSRQNKVYDVSGNMGRRILLNRGKREILFEPYLGYNIVNLRQDILTFNNTNKEFRIGNKNLNSKELIFGTGGVFPLGLIGFSVVIPTTSAVKWVLNFSYTFNTNLNSDLFYLREKQGFLFRKRAFFNTTDSRINVNSLTFTPTSIYLNNFQFGIRRGIF